MNERIDELAEQAGAVRYDFDTLDGTNLEELNKFAQLIIQECADLFVDQRYMVLNPLEPFANEKIRALKDHDKNTVRKIKEHFGVTE